MWVRCKQGWPGTFRRSVRDPKTRAIVKTLEFPPNEPIEITDPIELDAITPDIGGALEHVVPVDTRRKFAPPTEVAATAAAVETPAVETVVDPIADAVATNAAAEDKPRKKRH